MLPLVQSLRSKNLSDKTLSADVKRHLANMVINKEMKLGFFAALFNKSNKLHFLVDMGPDNTNNLLHTGVVNYFASSLSITQSKA